MRTHQQTDSELKDLLKAELARFQELNEQKESAWNALGETKIYSHGQFEAEFEAFQLIKAQWQDSADEIKHLHRKLYPNFPRGHACPNCGCDTMSVSGSNAVLDGCVACGTITDRWSL